MQARSILISALLFALFLGATARLMTPKELRRRVALAERVHAKLLGMPKNTSNVSATSDKGDAPTYLSGYFKVSPNSNSQLFYVFHPAKKSTEKDLTKVPIIIWLNGGPGCSSQEGNFIELGPYRIEKNAQSGEFEEVLRPTSWNDNYTILIVDQPIGTGLSYRDPADAYPVNEDGVSNHFYNFLVNFYQSPTFSKYKSTPLYIFGESYAGHYIPSIAKEILVRNEDSKHVLTIPLRGIGIGDGLTDPINQLSNNGLYAYALGLIDDTERQRVELAQVQGQALVREGRNAEAQESFGEIMDIIVNGAGGANVYNYRDFKGYDELDEMMVTFWSYEKTRERYGILPEVTQYVPCNPDVYAALINDFMDSVAPRLQYVVERIPVMLYNGQDDIIINTPSAEAWIRKFPWKYQEDFNEAQFQIWKYNGQVVGVGKTVENLSFVVVNKAGHLVPYDQIESSANMVWRFINKNYWN